MTTENKWRGHKFHANNIPGGCIRDWMAKETIDPTDYRVLEIGPKHGHHTAFIDSMNPKYITLLELKSKKPQVNKWIKTIKSKHKLLYQDFNTYDSDEKYNMIWMMGVIYHNLNPVGMLRRAHSFAADEAYLCFESATTRNKDLKKHSVIEVLPNGPNNILACPPKMFPSKQGCLDLLELTGWEVIHHKFISTDRITVLAKKIKQTQTYNGEVRNEDL
jgi:hypothetical protein